MIKRGVINQHHNEQTRSTFYRNVCIIRAKYDSHWMLRSSLEHKSKYYTQSKKDFRHELWIESIFTMFTLKVPKLWWHICWVCYSQRGKEDTGWVFVCWIVTGWYKRALAGVLIISSQNKQQCVTQVSSISPTIDPTSAWLLLFSYPSHTHILLH